MKILFFMTHFGNLRNFESTVRELARRGHRIHFAFLKEDKMGERRVLERIMENHPEAGFTEPRTFKGGTWQSLARATRFSMDYLRYLHPRYQTAEKLRERAEGRVPDPVRRVKKLFWGRPRLIRVATWFLSAVEWAIPDNQEMTEFIRSNAPDMVLVTPLVDLGSDQVDCLKSAKRLGLRTGLLVHSWDNLTNKGLIRIIPDLVAVWNESQKQEAVELHDVPESNIAVTGAMPYDQWFERKPSISRAAFCKKAGLDPERPFLLYLCSSPFIAPDEKSFVEKWIQALRRSGNSHLKSIGVLVRPHPQNAAQWVGTDLAGLGVVSIWPRQGINPIDDESRANYFDSIYHCSAVAGLNTSALIETAIVGRSVYTILTEEFSGTQEGTLHFHYLLNVNGGLLNVARNFEEHIQQLGQALNAGGENTSRNQRFLESFVRPYGLDTSATPRMVGAIEKFKGGERRGITLAGYLLRSFLYPLVFTVWCRQRAVPQTKVFFDKVRGRLWLTYKTVKSHRKKGSPLWIAWPKAVFMAILLVIVNRLLRFEKIRSFVLNHVASKVLEDKKSLPIMAINASLPLSPQIGPLKNYVDHLAEQNRPILVGPWIGEVGFELLYWIPFLNWMRTYRPALSERMIVVSRGGTAPWYKNVSSNYVEVFDYISPEQFRLKNEQRAAERGGKLKQKGMSSFDKEILDMVKRAMNVSDEEIVHPSLMYQVFWNFFKTAAPTLLIDSLTSFQRLEKLPLDHELKAALPERYAAVKFYFSYAFPDTESNRAFVSKVVRRLAEKTNVVLLNTGLRIDDHHDSDGVFSDRVHNIAHLIRPRNNLETQTKIICHADSFVGTYGGFSYLAPFYGVDSLSFYSDAGKFLPHHLDLARRVFVRPDWGSFVSFDVQDMDLIEMALDGANPRPLPSRAREPVET